MQAHKERDHSDWSASGAEIWTNCDGSVAAAEKARAKGVKDKASSASTDGTLAHEKLEKLLSWLLLNLNSPVLEDYMWDVIGMNTSQEMAEHVKNSANFIMARVARLKKFILIIEKKVFLSFIHPGMFGTPDAALINLGVSLEIFDFKYGFKTVSPVKNLQLIYYAVALAKQYNWNFKKVRLWIIQPRSAGYDGPAFYDLSIGELKTYVKFFEDAVDRTLDHPDRFKEGAWCWFCKGKTECPLKTTKRTANIIGMFK